jgi:hypothetical protein
MASGTAHLTLRNGNPGAGAVNASSEDNAQANRLCLDTVSALASDPSGVIRPLQPLAAAVPVHLVS